MIMIIHNHSPMDDGGVCLTCGPGDEDESEDAESENEQEEQKDKSESAEDTQETSEE